MRDGLHIDDLPNGNVRLIAVAGNGKVKLTVEAQHALRLAARLIVAAAPWVKDNPGQADKLVTNYLRTQELEETDCG